MFKKEDIVEMLNKNNIEFEIVEHEAVYTMEDIDNLNLNMTGATEVKNLFLRDEKGKNHFLIVAKEDTKIDMKVLKDKIGSSRLSFASEERLEKYLHLTRGCVSPFGILNDENREVKVYIDKNIKNDLKIGVHPNENTSTIFISTNAVENILKQHGNYVEYIDF